MLEKELLRQALSPNLPDLEAVREACLQDRPKPAGRRLGLIPAAAGILAATLAGVVFLSPDGGAVRSPDSPAPQTSAGSAISASSAAGDAIRIHQLSAPPQLQTMNIGLFIDDQVLLSLPELDRYYGAAVSPRQLPPDLSAKAGESRCIYRRNQGQGELYFDQNRLTYSNEDGSRLLIVDVSKIKPIFYDVSALSETELQPSTLGGRELLLARYSSEEDGGVRYYAKMTVGDAHFAVSSIGLTQQEFLAAVDSIAR